MVMGSLTSIYAIASHSFEQGVTRFGNFSSSLFFSETSTEEFSTLPTYLACEFANDCTYMTKESKIWKGFDNDNLLLRPEALGNLV